MLSNGGVKAQNGAVEGLQNSGRRIALMWIQIPISINMKGVGSGYAFKGNLV
jgi:hypothetical protein